MKSFWEFLPKPFTALAPMDGVTDTVFRDIINQIGRPDVFFTEFTSVEGLNSDGRERVAESLMFSRSQKPVVAQIWGTDIDAFYKASVLCSKMGFDGIDINMGCPDRVVIKNGACSALIKNPTLAKEIIDAVKKGSNGLPVSVKTRLGFSSIDIKEWIGFLLEQDLDAISVHLRTVAEMSKVPAHWDRMTEIISLRDKISKKTLIIGNGDIKSLEEIKDKYDEYKCDGFMIGRGIFSNPWLFNEKIHLEKVTIEERISLFMKHILLFEKTFPEKNPAFLKKFCKTYFNNFDEASILREKIMECSTTSEMKNLLKNYAN